MNLSTPHSPDDLRRLVEGTHTDPHTFLGPHPGPHGVIVRALRPDASEVVALLEGGAALPLARIHPAGVFEGLLPGTDDVPAYQLEARYASGDAWTTWDAYAFLPTLGPIDLHLIGEGRHERLWERLGARPLRPTVADGIAVDGVAFAVWAPEAARVSVVGDFNRWDGRTHPMRRLGASGVWELFIPDLGPGARYQFEIRTTHGLVAKKAGIPAASQQAM